MNRIPGAINVFVYLFRAFKLHPSFLQSGLVEKTNRCHCCTFIYFFNLEKRKNYIKFLSSVYFPFLVPRTVSLRGRFIVTVSIVRDYFSSRAIIYSNYCNGYGRLKISSRSEIRLNPDFLKIRTYKKGFQPLTSATQAYQERFISLFQKQYAEVGCIIITKKIIKNKKTKTKQKKKGDFSREPGKTNIDPLPLSLFKRG